MKFKVLAGLAIVGLAGLCIGAGQNTDSARFMVMGDCRNFPGFTTLLEKAKAVEGGPGSFVITPGDIDPPDQVRAEISRVIGADFPWFPVIGNHDATKANMPYMRKYFSKELLASLPAQITGFTPGPAGTVETTYSFDAGPVHFAIINEYWDGTDKPDADCKTRDEVVPELNKWLGEDLKKSTKPWKIVVGHEPAFPQADQDWSKLEPSNKDARHADSSLNAKVEHRDAFVKTLSDNHATVYFCGHTHRYSRYQIPETKVWQIDSARARGSTDWKYDAFIVVAATEAEFKVSVYRNLKVKGEFENTDTLVLKAGGAESQPATQAGN